MFPKGPGDGGLVSSVALLDDGGTFKRWGLVGGFKSLGAGVLSMRVVGPVSPLSLWLCNHEVGPCHDVLLHHGPKSNGAN
jgi:hypothetical protein